MPFEDILFTKEDGVARITFNRPQAYNAFRTQTLREMARALAYDLAKETYRLD